MAQEPYRIVGRMEGFFPHQLAHYEMHRKRLGGNRGHCEPTRSHLNRILIGDHDWAKRIAQRIEDIRFQNHERRLASLERRQRKADLMVAVVEGAGDPWRATAIGPMREMILTANKDYFAASDLGQAECEQRFVATADAWLRDTFGDAVVHARVDHDEAACHIHAVLLPLVKDKSGRITIQPSSHPLIKDYEKFQDAIGEAFSPLGLQRGEKRAEEIRQAIAKVRAGEKTEIPRRRKHVPTYKWREDETARLVREANLQDDTAIEQVAMEGQSLHERMRLEERQQDIERREQRQEKREACIVNQEVALEAATAEHTKMAAAVKERAKDLDALSKQLSGQRRDLDLQAAEQDAFAAAAEAVAAGVIDLDAPQKPNVSSEADRVFVRRINREPIGLRRFLDAILPAWARMRKQAQAKADAEVQRERDEIAGAWSKLSVFADRLNPRDSARAERDGVGRAIALWRTLAARDKGTQQPGSRDDN